MAGEHLVATDVAYEVDVSHSRSYMAVHIDNTVAVIAGLRLDSHVAHALYRLRDVVSLFPHHTEELGGGLHTAQAHLPGGSLVPVVNPSVSVQQQVAVARCHAELLYVDSPGGAVEGGYHVDGRLQS